LPKITREDVEKKLLNSSDYLNNEKTLGKRTAEKGYKKAPIIKRTTLYNAAEKSKKVPYVPQGKDAMVSYGSSDLKFRNNRQNGIAMPYNYDKIICDRKALKFVKNKIF